MKKCPECGNPSYDGAPVCGNCGYKFPKTKAATHNREDIFQQNRLKKKSRETDVISIIKQEKLIIGIILIITLIIIGGIVLIGTDNNNDSNSLIKTSDLSEFKEDGFSFKYPNTWTQINMTDEEHPEAIFFQNDNATIEYYNITSDASSLKDITQQRINYAQESGDYIELVETITLDGRNSSNIIIENVDGNYTRYVSMFSDGKLYVFKITGDSENSLTSESIQTAINSADIA